MSVETAREECRSTSRPTPLRRGIRAAFLTGLASLLAACGSEPVVGDAEAEAVAGDAGGVNPNDHEVTDAVDSGKLDEMDAAATQADAPDDGAVMRDEAADASGSARDGGLSALVPCDAEALTLTPLPSNVMLALEHEQLRDAGRSARIAALQPLLNASSVNLGAHVYSALQNDVETFFRELNMCGKPVHNVLPIAGDAGQAVATWLSQQPAPNPNFSHRPLLGGLGYYLEKSDLFPQDADAAKYLVVVTEGRDNCFGSSYRLDVTVEAALERMAIELARREIRLVPVATNAPDAATLRGFSKAQAHGWLEKSYEARDVAALPPTLAEVAERVRACRFKSTPASVARLALDGVPLERDRTRRAGWDVIDSARGVVEVFGAECAAVRRGAVLRAEPECSQPPPCVSRRLALEPVPRTIRFLVSAGLSMSTCTVADVECASGAALTWSGFITTALAGALASPAYEDYAFGLHNYPDRDGAECGVSSRPLVPEHVDAELSILRRLSNPAQGSSPLLQVFEAIAERPGALAATPGASALIVLGNGNSNCGGVANSEQVLRLTAAAGKLASAGVQVFPVRIGPRDAAADQDAFMRAVGSSSNLSGLPVAAGAPYLDVLDPAALSDLLQQILRRFGTCSVRLKEPLLESDARALRLSLGAAPVPFDGAGAKVEGWGFAGASRQELELYGTACERFRQGSAAELTLEVGCGM